MLKCCLVCGRPSRGNRCDAHAGRVRTGSTRRQREQRSLALIGATACWICGDGPREADPFEADHVVAASLGGQDTAANFRPAHRSCNRRRGAGRTA